MHTDRSDCSEHNDHLDSRGYLTNWCLFRVSSTKRSRASRVYSILSNVVRTSIFQLLANMFSTVLPLSSAHSWRTRSDRCFHASTRTSSAPFGEGTSCPCQSHPFLKTMACLCPAPTNTQYHVFTEQAIPQRFH